MTNEISFQIDDDKIKKLLGIPLSNNADQPHLKNPFWQASDAQNRGDLLKAETIYLQLLNNDWENVAVMMGLAFIFVTKDMNALSAILINKILGNLDKLEDSLVRVGMIPKFVDEKNRQDWLAGKRAELLNALGSCYKHENRCEEARKAFTEAQLLVPLNADIQNNLGTLGINEGDPQGALDIFDIGLSIDKDHAQLRWNRSLALLELGRYKEGWAEYQYGIPAKVRQDRKYQNASLPVWNGEKNQTIVVYGEQGLGDEILFMSVLKELIADSKKVVLECHTRLHTLFAATFPEIDIYGTREDDVVGWVVKPDGTPRYQFDAKISVGDLMKFYRDEEDKIPGTAFLKIPDDAIARGKALLDQLPPGKRIGISWIGGAKRTRIEVRSLHLEQMLPILKAGKEAGCHFVSLQYTPCDEEIAVFEKKHGIQIWHDNATLQAHNYAETAGLVLGLDLVISVATSVCHLAGGLGIDTWVLTPSRAAWREFHGGDKNPFYKSWRMFRQASKTVDWTPVVQKVADELAVKFRLQSEK